MTNPAQRFTLTSARVLWKPALALALVCALTMVATLGSVMRSLSQ